VAKILGQSGAWKDVLHHLRVLGISANSPQEVQQYLHKLKEQQSQQQEVFGCQLERDVQLLSEEIIKKQNDLPIDIAACKQWTLNEEVEIINKKEKLAKQLAVAKEKIFAETERLKQCAAIYAEQEKQAITQVEQKYNEKSIMLEEEICTFEEKFVNYFSEFNNKLTSIRGDVLAPIVSPNLSTIKAKIHAIEEAIILIKQQNIIKRTWDWLKPWFLLRTPYWWQLLLLESEKHKEEEKIARMQQEMELDYQRRLFDAEKSVSNAQKARVARLQKFESIKKQLIFDRKSEIDKVKADLCVAEYRSLNQLKQQYSDLSVKTERDLVALATEKKGLKEKESTLINALRQKIRDKESYVNYLTENKDEIIKNRCQGLNTQIYDVNSLLHSKEFVGAQAELQTIEQLNRLSDKYYVLNDVQLKAMRYMKYNDSVVQSAQIDHIVVSTYGIFIIEVKHWSQKFAESGQFYNPYEQVSRANYLCYCLLREELNIEIKIRSIVAYGGHLPPKEGKYYVKVLPINGLLGYIKYFRSPLLNQTQMEHIVNWFF